MNAAHRLIVLLLGVLVAWLGPLTSVQAVLGTAGQVPFYVNNGQQHTAMWVESAAERGPPIGLFRTDTYTYDGAGNLKTIGAWSFEYDGVSRLTKATIYDEPVTPVTAKTQSFVYDPWGNLKEIQGFNGRMIPVSATTNRLTSPGTTYDAAGNLLTWNQTPTQLANYSWDALDRMWRMQNGSEEWLYLYTADDERAWSYKVGGTLSRWTLRGLGGEVLRELEAANGTWTVTNDSIYRGDQLLAAQTPAGVRHYHLDHLGSPRLITNAAGAQVAYHVYLPYGEESTAFNQDALRMKFTGHERDLASSAGPGDDLDYMHARFCSPVTGRFLGVDASPGVPTKPQSWNGYAYAMSNPIARFDPDGHFGLGMFDIYPPNVGADESECECSASGRISDCDASGGSQRWHPDG